MILKDVIEEQIQEGKLVIFSSHQMNYVEEFCEEIVILHHGDIVLQGNLKQIKKDFGRNRIVLRATHNDLDHVLREQCKDLFQIYTQKDTDYILELHAGVTRQQALQKLMGLDVDIEAFYVYEASLTDIFVEKAGDEA